MHATDDGGVQPPGSHRPRESEESVHAVLRRETEVWHRAVEEAFAPLDLTNRSDLALFLSAQARAVLPLEDTLTRHGIERLVPDWPARRRADALQTDLRLLGVPAPLQSGPLGSGGSGQMLGALYVLEGSRLGGRLIARQVADSADPDVRRATAFLRHAVAPGAWAAFLSILNTASDPVADIVQGARDAFASFRDAANEAVAGRPGVRATEESLVPPRGA